MAWPRSPVAWRPQERWRTRGERMEGQREGRGAEVLARTTTTHRVASSAAGQTRGGVAGFGTSRQQGGISPWIGCRGGARGVARCCGWGQGAEGGAWLQMSVRGQPAHGGASGGAAQKLPESGRLKMTSEGLVTKFSAEHQAQELSFGPAKVLRFHQKLRYHVA